MSMEWMISSDSVSGLEVNAFTKENHIRAKHLSSSYHVPGSSLLCNKKYLINLPTHSARQILVTIIFTDKETEDWEISKDFTVGRVRVGIKCQGVQLQSLCD